MFHEKRYAGVEMLEEFVDAIEVTSASGLKSESQAEESAISLFDADGNFMLRLSVPNRTMVEGRHTITRDDVRDLLEGHTVKRYDFRVEQISPDFLVCDVHPAEGALTVRFDDEKNPAFWAEVQLAPQIRSELQGGYRKAGSR